MVLLAIGWAVNYYWHNLRGAGPALRPPSKDIAEEIKKAENLTEFPLSLPDGFTISIFAKDLPGARVMAFDRLGNMWVSQPTEGKITQLEIRDGRVKNQNVVFTSLNRPHGLAFHHDNPLLLYIAESDKVSRVPLYTEGQMEKLIDLPDGGRHFTRTLMFLDDRLLISVGSSCDTCEESDWRRAKILSANRDGSDLKVFAEGLRNAVFMTRNPTTGDVWVTEMGRDFLGDDLPPDEVNIINGPPTLRQAQGLIGGVGTIGGEQSRTTSSGQNAPHFGWPYCYGRQVHDSKFDPTGARAEFCKTTVPSQIDLQAHVAPLGLGFIPEEAPNQSDQESDGTGYSWPEDYQGDLIIAYHGSWNRSTPVGYKLSKIKLDDAGNFQGEEDFITGWLKGRSALGRPVDILIQPGGVMYVSDDHAGVIYEVVAD